MRRLLLLVAMAGILSPQSILVLKKKAGATLAVTKIGAANSPGVGSVLTIPLSGSVSAGAGVVVAILATPYSFPGSEFAVTVTDSKGNTYSTDAQKLQATYTAGQVQLSSASIASALTSGVDSIIVTPSLEGHVCAIAYSVTKRAASSALDVTAVGLTSGNSPVTDSMSPTGQPRVAFAAFGAAGGAWSAFGNIIASAATGLDSNYTNSASRGLSVQWRELTATTAGTATMTGTGGWAWAQVMAAYKEE